MVNRSKLMILNVLYVLHCQLLKTNDSLKALLLLNVYKVNKNLTEKNQNSVFEKKKKSSTI